ncbi:MAG: glycosyltransferase family 4 protein [Candidatus Brennerbacteria bacterium]|nr:glycosyltransferase family 4 protein [Candidatus Brennerbacteria bacterium]
MKVAFIHNDKKIGTGAHFINELLAIKLREKEIDVKNFYPRTSLIDPPVHLKGLSNILFFYSLLEKKDEIMRFNLVQGTTYTPLPFLAFNIPVVSHFGSTTRGFLESTPQAKDLLSDTRRLWYRLRKDRILPELNVRSRKPMRDIADIEEYVAKRADAVIAVSENVKKELIETGVNPDKITVIHNAIEDYWFEKSLKPIVSNPAIVFLGRLGGDAFTLKLKGLDRLVHLYSKFPKVKKITICLLSNKKLKDWLRVWFERHQMFVNFKKDLIPNVVDAQAGSILFIPSRYEGFSLSLIEGMSQGLIPVSYRVGVAPEIIVNGENGFLVSSQIEAISVIENILKDETLRRKLSEGAYQTSLKFRSDIIVDELLNLYSRTLKEYSSASKKLSKQKITLE